APMQLIEGGYGVVRHPEYFGRLPDGAAGTVGNDIGGEPGAAAAIFLIDILHHLLAPFVLEIDIDIGRFVALRGDETAEDQIGLARIDGGNAQAEADRGI